MTPPEKPRWLWGVAWREVVLGPRGVVKTSALWLTVALGAATGGALPSVGELLALLGAVVLWAQGSILVNDLSDRSDDLAAGKERWIQTLPGRLGAVVAAALLAAGLAACLAGRAPCRAIAAYAAAAALGVLYSVWPTRLKDRGALGPLGYAGACTLAYAVLPWAWMEADWLVLAAAGAVVFFDKWVNLHFHQVVDYEADSSRGRQTLAVGLGLRRAREVLGWLASAAAVVSFAPLVVVALRVRPWGAAIGFAAALVALAASAYARWARRGGERASALVSELPASYLGVSFAVLRVLPLALLGRVALAEPRVWVFFALAALVIAGESAHAFRYRYR